MANRTHDTAQRRRSEHSSSRRRRRRSRSTIYLILAIVVFLVPVVLTHLQNNEQHRVAEEFSRSVEQLAPDERNGMLERAREYNDRLPEFGAPDPWMYGPDTNSEAYQDYLNQLNVNSVMARVQVPSVGIDLPIYHGTSTSALAHGVGHLYGTALPVGGEGTHSVLTAHTGMSTLTMFDNLTHVKKGDDIIIDVAGEKLAYRVDHIQKVLPTQVENIRPEVGKDYVTLVTCTPYGFNTHRLLVRGERIDEPEHIQREYRSPWQLWMTLAVGIAVLILLYLLWRWFADRRRDRREREREARERQHEREARGENRGENHG